MKTRSDWKAVSAKCDQYRAIALQCIREHWTCTRYIDARKAVWGLPAHATAGDAATVIGYARGLFDLINTGLATEWRLGFEDLVLGALPRQTWRTTQECEDATGRMPTHGAHFWTGTDELWGDWRALGE